MYKQIHEHMRCVYASCLLIHSLCFFCIFSCHQTYFSVNSFMILHSDIYIHFAVIFSRHHNYVNYCFYSEVIRSSLNNVFLSNFFLLRFLSRFDFNFISFSSAIKNTSNHRDNFDSNINRTSAKKIFRLIEYFTRTFDI